MTHKDTVDAIRLSLLLADSKADRRLGILRGQKHIPVPLPAPIPSLAPAAHHYVLPIVIPTARKHTEGTGGWAW